MELKDINLKELIERETGERFSRDGLICCPFHMEKTPSLSVYWNSKTSKECYKCFGCGEHGDALDFIMKLKNCNIIEAKKYLGMSVDKSQKEKNIDSIKGYIKWQMEKPEDQKGCKKGFELINIYEYVGLNSKPLYYKAKFLKPDGKKTVSYYSFKEDRKVTSIRPEVEVPYNLARLMEGINKQHTVIVCEGEKDADTLNYILKGEEYVATSLKGIKDFSMLKGYAIKLIICGDTGEAGERYINNIKWEFIKKEDTYSLKVAGFPGLKSLGDNKDVTDWIELGNSKKELLAAFDRSLDIKNINFLQQDKGGIYKKVWSNKEEAHVKIYLTNFNIIEARKMTFIDDNSEGVKIKFRSQTGKIIERIGESSIFADVRTFKTWLGTIELAWKGKVEDLTEFAIWINRFWAIEDEEMHNGTKFMLLNKKMHFITATGSYTRDSFNSSVKAKDGVDIHNIQQITKEELQEVKDNIFKFATKDKSIPLIGSVIHSLFSYHNDLMENGSMNITLIVGESGSGKTTIVKNLVSQILNYPVRDVASIGMSTKNGINQMASLGNYPCIFEEYKPSNWDRNKKSNISDFIRNVYDRNSVIKGTKNVGELNKARLERPVIIAGEECYPNSETAAMERSTILYFSKGDKTQETIEGHKWIKRNHRLLNKLGRSLIQLVLEITPEQYEKAHRRCEDMITEKISNDRMITAGSNVLCGFQLFNSLSKRNNIDTIKDHLDYIIENIENEVLEGEAETKSITENMLLLYDSMIDSGRASWKIVVMDDGADIYISTGEMITQMNEFVKTTGAGDVVLIGQKDFVKQATKSGYITSKSIKASIGGKQRRCHVFNRDKLLDLGCECMVNKDLFPSKDVVYIERQTTFDESVQVDDADCPF